MKLLIKTGIMLLVCFTIIFLIMQATGIFSAEAIEQFINNIRDAPVWLAALIIILLLTADLFFTIPTLATVIVSGFVLGSVAGGAVSSIGLLCSGSLGYWLSRRYGNKIMHRVCKNKNELEDMKRIFSHQGRALLLLSRSAPMLPEISSCLAGISRMPYAKYLIWYMVGSVPYALIAAYAGSVSSIERPQPAIHAILILYATLWLSWWIYRRIRKRAVQKTTQAP